MTRSGSNQTRKRILPSGLPLRPGQAIGNRAGSGCEFPCPPGTAFIPSGVQPVCVDRQFHRGDIAGERVRFDSVVSLNPIIPCTLADGISSIGGDLSGVNDAA